MTQAIAAAAMLALIIAACTTTADTDIRVGIAPDTEIILEIALDTDIITEIAPGTDIMPETLTNTPVITPTDACGASGYQSLVGTNIAAITLPADLNHRIIGPKEAYSQDYVPSRLNIFTDEDGVIVNVNCG